MAGNPRQLKIKNPVRLIGEQLVRKLGIRSSDLVYRCQYCGVVYISTGVLGTERILGEISPAGFKAIE